MSAPEDHYNLNKSSNTMIGLLGVDAVPVLSERNRAFLRIFEWLAFHVGEEQRLDGFLIEIVELHVPCASSSAIVESGVQQLLPPVARKLFADAEPVLRRSNAGRCSYETGNPSTPIPVVICASHFLANHQQPAQNGIADATKGS
jgi:hypothetical protein